LDKHTVDFHYTCYLHVFWSQGWQRLRACILYKQNLRID
jgi:hypothetical protein